MDSFDLTGRDIGRYHVVSRLGRGGMGDVYDAVDASLGRHVALKVLKSEAIGDRRRLTRFMREARAASALNHPNLVAIYEVGEHDDIPFIAMEKVDGSTLRDLTTRGRLPVKRAVELMLQVTEAVAAAHGAGIIHRDLKPENIMIASSGYAKVLDFGLAKLEAESMLSEDVAGTVVKATDSGVILGTPGYMSPEQALGKTADQRTDIFALGCILFELFAAKPPFRGTNAVDTLHKTLHTDPALDEMPASIGADLQRIVRKSLAKDPERRYQSVKEMLNDLRDAATSEVVEPDARVERKAVPQSIAVLPFENAARDRDNEYLVDGVTEILIHRLSEFRDLRVMARSTVFRFRGTDVDPIQAGRQLGVAAVVSGRVTIVRERVTIDVELIDTADGACLCGKRFDRPLSRIQEAQDEIAAAISEHLRVKLSPSQDKRLKERQRVDKEAYRLYLQGRFWWNKRPQEGFMKGVDLFHQAIEIDPLFALAYSGLADVYATMGSWESGLMAPRDAMPRAKAAAKRAIEIDPQLADPWASLGYILLHYDWKWDESAAAFARAIELNPNSVNAHHWLSHLHTAMAHPHESLDESLKTSDLDPLDLIANVHLAWHYWLARDAERVIEQSRRTASLEPKSFWPPFFAGLGHELRGDPQRATEQFREAVDRVPTATFAVAALAHGLGSQNRKEEAAALLQQLEDLAKTRYVPAYDRVIIAAGSGDNARAFTWLERALEERSGWLAYLDVDPRLDPLRGDTAFADVRKRTGLGSM